jgi:hypothetical protein
MSTPKRLIYLLSFGEPIYARMTALCVHSLRKWGRFRDEIKVFTDGSYRPAPGSDVEACNVGPLTGDLAIKSLKSFIAPAIDAGRYAQIAVMDSDMVAVGDVNELLHTGGPGIQGMREYPFNSMLADSCGGRLLTLPERVRASREWGINTGFLAMDARRFHGNMRAWTRAIRKDAAKANYWADQPYFNALVLRGRLSFRALPRYWIDMPPMYAWFNGRFQLKRATRLLHACGRRKEISLAQMEAVVDGLEAQRSRDEISASVRRVLAAGPQPLPAASTPTGTERRS